MKKKSMVFSFAAFFVLGTFFFSLAANAYIDPSAMTYLVQVIVGIVIAGGAALGFYFKKLKRKLMKDGVKKLEEDDTKKTAVQAQTSFENDDEFDDSKLSQDELNVLNGKKE